MLLYLGPTIMVEELGAADLTQGKEAIISLITACAISLQHEFTQADIDQAQKYVQTLGISVGSGSLLMDRAQMCAGVACLRKDPPTPEPIHSIIALPAACPSSDEATGTSASAQRPTPRENDRCV